MLLCYLLFNSHIISLALIALAFQVPLFALPFDTIPIHHYITRHPFFTFDVPQHETTHTGTRTCVCVRNWAVSFLYSVLPTIYVPVEDIVNRFEYSWLESYG